MAICRKKKCKSHKKVGRPEIGAAHKSQKVGGLGCGPPDPIGSAANGYIPGKLCIWLLCFYCTLFELFAQCPLVCALLQHLAAEKAAVTNGNLIQ